MTEGVRRGLVVRSRSRQEDTLALIRLLAYGPWNVKAGREVVRQLIAQGRDAVPALSRALEDPSTPRISRLAIAWILGAICGGEADDVLVRISRADDAEMADVAAAARGRCSGSAAPSAA